jgi:GxxExxY protein
MGANEFREVAYDVMRCLFDVHNALGRFFDEKIYKSELARRFPHVELEVPIDFTHKDFSKRFRLDVLVQQGAAFEFKTVERLTAKHRSQLLHYLLAADLPRGKLVNFRSHSVEHRFVNTTLRLGDRTSFSVVHRAWHDFQAEKDVCEIVVGFLRDWGTSLSLSLYDEALTHFLGGPQCVVQNVDILSDGVVLGQQKFRLVAPGVAFKITALAKDTKRFQSHARRLLAHARLRAIQWINITRREVAFQTIRPD